jgi:hypothetical protein
MEGPNEDKYQPGERRGTGLHILGCSDRPDRAWSRWGSTR